MNPTVGMLFILGFLALQIAEKNEIKGWKEASIMLAITFIIACIAKSMGWE